MFVLAPDGSRAYTSNVSTGTVSVVDLRKHTLITKIPVADKIQRISISAGWPTCIHARSGQAPHRHHRRF